MCAAVTVALLPLAVFAALTVLRLSAPSPNARFLAGLLDSLDRDPAAAIRHFAPPAATPVQAGRAETA